MNTFEELIQGVQGDLNINDQSPLYPLARVKSVINRAYIKAGGLFLWPETEDAKKTSTQANIEYYDYPRNWRSDSVFRVEIDDEQYGEDPDGSPIKFEDYLNWRRDPANANSTEKKWANQKRRYFVYPVPTTAGSYNISIWGHKVVDALVDNGDCTIFSYSMPECNEAIVLEAVAMLKSQGQQEKAGEFRSIEAKQILMVAWDKIQKHQDKSEKVQPMLEVPDFFGRRSGKDVRIGNF